jgi:phage baseplate assembly protein W
MSQNINGIGFPLRLDGRGRVVGSSGAQHVKEAIAQILLTRVGAQAFVPRFGSNVPNRVFNAVNAKSLIAGDAAEALRRWENRIELVSVLLLKSDDVRGVASYEVKYRLKGETALNTVSVGRNS